ncbi:MBL fold metallo-hydrolase [Bdellovibrionota bacterium FG-1]
MITLGQRKILTIDCDYLHPQYAASYLLMDRSHGKTSAAFIDNNTAHCVPQLLAALKTEGLAPEDVQYVIITHVHLDHAGGSSALMKACPRAVLLAHPRATKHVIDPSKLIASAEHVYGPETFQKLYGSIEAIDAQRVRAIEHNEKVPFGKGRPLRFIHTRGHANHHFCIEEPETQSIFTGDAFGICYPALQREGLFIFPTTSPTDFDAHEALNSIDLILAVGARQAYLAHFGVLTEFAAAALQLREDLRFSQSLVEHLVKQDGLVDPDPWTFCHRALEQHWQNKAQSVGLTLDAQDRELVRLDLDLNAQGLVHVAKKRLSKGL